MVRHMENIGVEELQRAARGFRWAARRAFLLGLQASTGGNISIRMGPDLFLTKPTGLALTECHDSDLVLVDGRGRPIEHIGKPTKEVPVHLAIFEARPDIHGIVHYHAPFTTAYAAKGRKLPLPTVHARRILKKIALISEYPEGSQDLAEAVSKAYRDTEVVALLMTHHGLIAVGSTLENAQYRAELMEESAKISLLSRLIP
jgi:L-ribulose-5-phosphate 4-epimerase